MTPAERNFVLVVARIAYRRMRRAQIGEASAATATNASKSPPTRQRAKPKARET
jgi:hypothetical protein